MAFHRIMLALFALIALSLVACGGGTADGASSQEEAGGDETAGDEAVESTEAAGEAAPTVAPLGPDASEAAHDAEYARSEIHRMEVELQAHLEADEVDCEDATEAREGICEVATRICAMDQSDADIAARCEAANADCEEARETVGPHCPE